MTIGKVDSVQVSVHVVMSVISIVFGYLANFETALPGREKHNILAVHFQWLLQN